MPPLAASIDEIRFTQYEIRINGEVSEWLKEHAWKACVGLVLTAGSNPALSGLRPLGYDRQAVGEDENTPDAKQQ